MQNHGCFDSAGPCLIICRQNDACTLLWITGNSGWHSDKGIIPCHFAAYKKGIHINKKYDSLHGIPLSVITDIMR
jgi:hypothetical protein